MWGGDAALCQITLSTCYFFIMIIIVIIVYLQLSSIQQIMIAQLSDGMMHPVNKFLQADVDGSSVMILCLLSFHNAYPFTYLLLYACSIVPTLLSKLFRGW